MKKVPLGERLRVKLQALGLSARKAKEVAKGLVPTASKVPVKGTVTGKLTARLIKLGLSERQAKNTAAKLAPLVRSAIKAKAKTKALTLDQVDDDLVNGAVDDAIAQEMAKEVVPKEGAKGLDLFRIMHGLTSSRTYLVSAVKKDLGIVAVRQLGPDFYNVKFYPTMPYWDISSEDLHEKYGAYDYLEREWYQRMHFSRAGLTHLLIDLQKKAGVKARVKALMQRYRAVTAAALLKAFDYLHHRSAAA